VEGDTQRQQHWCHHANQNFGDNEVRAPDRVLQIAVRDEPSDNDHDVRTAEHPSISAAHRKRVDRRRLVGAWCVVNRPESSWPRSCHPGVDLLRRCLEVGRGQDEGSFSSDVEDPDTFGLPGIDVLAIGPAALIRARKLLLSQVEKSWSAGTDHSKSTEDSGRTGHRAPL